jgi:hypothetical protein
MYLQRSFEGPIDRTVLLTPRTMVVSAHELKQMKQNKKLSWRGEWCSHSTSTLHESRDGEHEGQQAGEHEGAIAMSAASHRIPPPYCGWLILEFIAQG